MQEQTELLIVEDDKELRRLLTLHLANAGYQIQSAGTAQEAMKHLKSSHPKLVILDVNLPDEDGFSLCKKVQEHYGIPVIFLTGNTEESDALQGYHLGAEEYITKPFSIEVLKLKIHAILNRLYSNAVILPDYNDGHLYISFDKQIISVDGKNITVASSDFLLLKTFIQEPGIIFSKEKLLDIVWADQYDISEHAITESIHRLRAKLEDEQHKYFKTVYGMGYAWIGK